MKKRRLPPIQRTTGFVSTVAANALAFTVASYAEDSASLKLVGVAVILKTDKVGDIAVRLRTIEEVEAMIQMLLRHKRDVWPEAR